MSSIPTGETEDASSIADSSSLGFRSEADVEEEDAARKTLVNMGYSEKQADEALWLTRTMGGGGEGKMRVERAVEVLMRR
jgi:Holliday junction resolvasome RuvABC DNA-binding subunit